MNSNVTRVPLAAFPELAKWEVVVRLLLSIGLGGAIGLQRELDGRPAGLRTHTFVALASTVAMMVSAYGFKDWVGAGFRGDPSRIASGVITGIGFIGAGAIMRKDFEVHGVTTASTLFVAAGIGLAVAVWLWFEALIATIASLVQVTFPYLIQQLMLELYSRLERFYWKKKSVHQLKVVGVTDDVVGRILELCSNHGVIILSMQRTPQPEGTEIMYAEIRFPKPLASSYRYMGDFLEAIKGLCFPAKCYLDDQSSVDRRHAETRKGPFLPEDENTDIAAAGKELRKTVHRINAEHPPHPPHILPHLHHGHPSAPQAHHPSRS